MILKIAMIRHGQTKSNTEKRYLSFTDEQVCKEGIQKLKEYCQDNIYPQPDVVYTSPMERCIQTTVLLYPYMEYHVLEALTERNFGIWEGKQYEDLKDNQDYRRWIATGGTYECGGVESRSHFQRRCGAGFLQMTEEAVLKDKTCIAVICHGGTIMSLMDQLTHGEEEYYSWQTENGKGYLFDYDTVTGEVCKIQSL